MEVIGINTCEVLSIPPGTLLLNTMGGLGCCDSWGRKESDTTERLNWTESSLLLLLLPVENWCFQWRQEMPTRGLPVAPLTVPSLQRTEWGGLWIGSLWGKLESQSKSFWLESDEAWGWILAQCDIPGCQGLCMQAAATLQWQAKLLRSRKDLAVAPEDPEFLIGTVVGLLRWQLFQADLAFPGNEVGWFLSVHTLWFSQNQGALSSLKQWFRNPDSSGHWLSGVYSHLCHKEDSNFPTGNLSRPYAWACGLSGIGSISYRHAFPGGSESKSVCLQLRRPGFNPWIGKIPWRRKWQPSPVLLPWKSHGRRSLVGYSLWGRKESDTTERLYFLFLQTEERSYIVRNSS